MRRGLAIVAAATGGVVAFGVAVLPAGAATLDCDEDLIQGAVACVVDESWIRMRSGPGDAAGQWPPEGWRLVEYPRYGTDDAGEPCLRQITRYIAPDEPLPAGETAPWFEFNHPSAPPDDVDWGVCPPHEADQPPDLDAVVDHLAAELRRRLPAPKLAIAPRGRALTGLPAYLETAERALTVTDQLTLHAPWELAVNFDADGRYHVDWGAGNPEQGPFTVAGGTFPHGTVRHAYRQAGDYRVRVVDDWDVHVEVPGLPAMQLAYEIGYPPLKVTVAGLRTVRVTSFGGVSAAAAP